MSVKKEVKKSVQAGCNGWNKCVGARGGNDEDVEGCCWREEDKLGQD